MRYETAKANRLGNRNTNQDRFALIERPASALMVLADGMGGHQGGLIAANALVVKFTEAFRGGKASVVNPETFLNDTFVAAHHRIVTLGLQQTRPVTPRTTGVVCLIQNEQVWWAHVGDSRFYVLRYGNVVVRTRDHSVVEELLVAGQITEKQIRSHSQRGQVTRCLGNLERAPTVEIGGPMNLEAGDVVLLCSDGLWSTLSDEDIALSLAPSHPLKAALDDMAGRAELAGYPKCDNVSVIALRWHPTQAAAPAPPSTEDSEVAVKEKSAQPEVDHVIDEINAALEKVNQGRKETE